MRAANIFLIIIFLSSLGLSQNKTVSGVIMDEEDQPIPYANIVLYNISDTSLVKADYSDDNGAFTLKSLESGKYLLEVTNIGYKNILKDINISEGSVNLGVLQMLQNSVDLKEVTVKGQKSIIQVQADKTVFNVSESLNASGTNGFELLRKAPGVVIDNNDNLIVEGKSGVRIYINGRPSQLGGEDLRSYLQAMQSSEIEKIEIITQPSSKFEAEGNAGIINIVLKKEKGLGTNGSVSSSLNVNEFLMFNGSVSLNHRNKKSNLYANYSNSLGESYNFFNIARRQNGILIDSRSSTVNEIVTHNLRAGYDHYLNDKNTIGVIVSGSTNDRTSLTDSRTPISLPGQKIDSILVADNDEMRNASNLSGNLNYTYDSKEGHFFSIDLDHAYFSRRSDIFQPNIYYNPSEEVVLSENITSQLAPTEINISSLKVDYEQPFLKGVLSLGTKISYVHTQNDFFTYNYEEGVSILDSTQSNEFTYLENINAGYINYNRKWADKWNLQLGLRVENTWSKGSLISIQELNDEIVERNYTNFFGSGGLTYQVNQKHGLALQYSRRIQRPNYEDLNPFEFKLNELSLRKGNPFLQPQYTDNVKLSHTYNYRFTTSLSYSYVRDFFAQVTEQNGEKGGFINTRNVANQRTINLGMSYPFNFNNWWNLYTSINAFYSAFEATNEDFIPIDQTTLNLYLQNTISLPWDTKMEISGWFNTPSIWGGTYRTQALGALNLAFQKKFFSNALAARIAFNDIFFTSPWNATTTFGNVDIVGNGGRNSRMATVSLTYTFGDKSVKGARKRETGLESEKDRAGQ